MSSTFRQWRNRLHCSNKQNLHYSHLYNDNELKHVHNTMELLLNENTILKARIDKLEERCQRWTVDEQTYLLKRIENLENENHQLHEIHLTYQIQNETSVRSITDLIMKILLTQQELRKERIQRHNGNDVAHWRRKQQVETNTRSVSCDISSNQLDDSRCSPNDQTTWFHQRSTNVDDEQDQQTTNHSSEFDHQLSTLAAVKTKSDKSATGLTNKLYFLLNNEKTPRANHRLPDINIVPVDGSNISSPRKQQSSVTFNKNKPTRTTLSNHERSPTNRPSSIVKNTPTTSVTKPARVPTTPVRPATTNVRQRPSVPSTANAKTVSSSAITDKSARPRYALAKSSEPLRSVSTTARPALKPPLPPNKPNAILTKTPANTIKPRKPMVPRQPARVSDLDALMAEQEKKNIVKKPAIPTLNHMPQSLFLKNTVKLVRPVRSQELKLFSYHLTPELPTPIPASPPFPTNDSLCTLTPPSLESIAEKASIEKKDDYSDSSTNVPSMLRDLSEDSLNEHYHIEKLLRKSEPINAIQTDKNRQDHSSSSDITPITPIKIETSADSAYCNGSMEQENDERNVGQGYFLLTDENSTPPHSQLSSKVLSSSQKSLVHRLVFPARLGRLIFHRRILSDSDIYQKLCSKDNEIVHNVYHLDTIRDYSMEFHMLTTYASDSQLRAWIDSNDDEIINSVCHFDENRFQMDDYDYDEENHIGGINSSDSLIEEGELDWYSELDVLNLSANNQQDKQDTTSSCSSKIHVEELLQAALFSLSSPTTTTSVDSASSAGLTSSSWSAPNDTSNQFHSTPIHFDNTNHNNSILHEILNHSWRDHLPTTATTTPLPDETHIDHDENDSTSSLITDEFQSDFYYLCPVTTTTTFSKIDQNTLYHDV